MEASLAVMTLYLGQGLESMVLNFYLLLLVGYVNLRMRAVDVF